MTDVTTPNFTDELIEKFQAFADDSSSTSVKLNKKEFEAFLQSARKFRSDAVVEILNRQQEIDGLVKQLEASEAETNNLRQEVEALLIEDFEQSKDLWQILASVNIFNFKKKMREIADILNATLPSAPRQ